MARFATLPNRWKQPFPSITLVVETESFCAGKKRKPTVRQLAVAAEAVKVATANVTNPSLTPMRSSYIDATATGAEDAAYVSFNL
jgi:hypothetical protein